MGLLSFAKSVGTKIFGATETAAAPPEQLKQEAAKHGLDVSKVEVKTEGDKVILSGSAASTEEAEKITLAIGNSVGVATVQNDLAAAAKAPGSKFYTVKPGDSLWRTPRPNMATAMAANIIGFLQPTSLCCPIPTRSIQAKCCGFHRFRAETAAFAR